MIEATVISTASLIALSAQATRCEDCICSESSSIRVRNSSGSPKRLKGLPSMGRSKQTRHLAEVLRRLADERGIAIFLVEHNIDVE